MYCSDPYKLYNTGPVSIITINLQRCKAFSFLISFKTTDSGSVMKVKSIYWQVLFLAFIHFGKKF